jgi:outer membrane protein OmpA-like peptidoglycan-associated protein
MTLLLMRRSSERAARRLASGISDLKTALSSAEDPEQSKPLETSAANIGVVGKELSSLHATLTSLAELNANAASKTAAFDALAGRIAAESLGLSALLGGGETAPVQDSDAPSVSSIDPGVAAEALVAEAERFAALASALALSNRLAAPKPVAPDPRTVLEDYAKRHAVFFANGTDYRHAAETGQTLDALVPLLKTAGTLVRIIGYTDVAGAVATNSTLAQERADKVRADLIQRGAPANLLAAVGRRDSIDLSPSQGIDSPNRRVAFELGYDGENTR